MKKILMAVTIAMAMVSCGSEDSRAEGTSDSTTVMDANQAPMGDTANQINSNAGSFTGDTSNRNGDDSISGTNPASRRTTPGNDTSRRSF